MLATLINILSQFTFYVIRFSAFINSRKTISQLPAKEAEAQEVHLFVQGCSLFMPIWVWG